MISRIAAKYKKIGGVGLLLILLRKCPGIRAISLYYIYVADIEDVADVEDIDGPPGSFNYVLSADKESAQHLINISDKPDIFGMRLSIGHFFVLAYENVDPVAYLWAHVGAAHTEQRFGFKIPISDKQVFYYDSYTRAAWRRRGLLRGMLTQLALYAKTELRKEELVAMVEFTNFASARAHERLGFSRTQIKLYMDILGCPIHLPLRDYRPAASQGA